MSTSEYPTAVVFDLDYTLWPCWCDTHISPPLKSLSQSEIIDSSKMKLSFYPQVESIILELVANNVTIIGASRTATPSIAKKILTLLCIDGKSAIHYFDALEWGQGSKTKHIRLAAKQLGLTEELEQGGFILFDDEMRNKDVASINCHFAHVPNESLGLTRNVFEKGLQSWREGGKTKRK
ncbi:hypothetical protein CORT_0D06330 [Candida orthopsilosis Co 90-125]|uniref:Magnesium-dependent phosphatase n=1 Tax=Candida orthopsilosis (strain 90-125) TaxID=1136231 RepID=H8X5L1_CANO9|nr:hypothetical protein CORT_0D06330 [Candida orthopsilosis Co 90-125]CCG23469.1 hypothetical protein CORT_0D06330 [Candida orthopsilosis Co 90-125]